MIWQYLLLVMAAWNVIVLILYGIDKWKAKHDRWRISEAALLGSAFCLGGAGALFGMTVFHHKTKKWKFRILVPLSVVLQAAVVYGILPR
ncbi:DUF1294 domain-containing protein [Sellimonas catena]|uniref:Membrane protein n=1 Tax=Sellimonas catena TaxID=2994035 RepID=A0A9W6C7H3_9FIRM|nr:MULTISPECIES: DUF1294 domain-containing protein [Sellimonas]GLG05202.1 membrane protein [Sellimonas catena]